MLTVSDRLTTAVREVVVASRTDVTLRAGKVLQTQTQARSPVTRLKGRPTGVTATDWVRGNDVTLTCNS